MEDELQEVTHDPDVTGRRASAPIPDERTDDARRGLALERAALEGGEDHDLLEEPVLPLFGLSATTVAVVFAGGALGTVCRYLLAAHHAAGTGAFPWVTLLVNLSGSLAIGALVPLTEHVSHRAPWARPLLVVGFLGGWTTYSTLAVDATLLARDGELASALAYLVATVAGGLALVAVGHGAGRRLTAR